MLEQGTLPAVRPGSSPPSASRLDAAAFTRAASAIAIAVGVLVLIGWALDVAALRGPIPGLVEMKSNTAVAFVLAGASLWLLARRAASRRRRAAGRACAAAAALIGGVSLAEYAFDWNAGIDELLFEDKPGAAQTVHPGRLAPQTALGFLLLGLGLVMLHTRGRLAGVLVQVFAAGATLMSLFAIVGYSYGAFRLSTVAAFTPIALHTAIALLLLSLGLLASRADFALSAPFRRGGPGSVMARRLLPFAVVVLPIVGWVRLEGEQAGLYDARTGVALFVLVFLAILYAGIVATARLLDRVDDERRQAAISQQRLAAIVEHSDDAIIGKTTEGVITSWNRAAERIYGYSAAEAVGERIGILIPQRRAGEEREILRRVVAGEAVRHFDTERISKDGREIEVSLTVSPIRDANGAIVGASAVARDITDRRRAERELAEAREEAERANRAKSEFLSRMSHELRTPLNSVIGFGQLLEMDGLGAIQREHVERIVKGGRHLLELINEVLDISRIEAGTIGISIEPVDVDAAVYDALELIRPLALAQGLRLDGPSAVAGRRYVVADQQRLRQILLNLLSNAVKYNRSGGRIAVSVEERGERLAVGVMDTGSGLTPEQIGRLFVPFERLGAEGGDVQGTGLGLALSRRLAEAMNGTIEVESEPGVGSTFRLALPRDDAPSAAEAVVEVARAPFPNRRQSRSRLLYIEDNLSNVRLIEEILARRDGVALLTAMQGRLGLELAQRSRPDLIVLDLHLPDMHGSEVLACLRANPDTRAIPVVILSADATDNQIARLLEAGASDYLTKPLDVRGFLDVIDEHLGTDNRNAPPRTHERSEPWTNGR